MRKRISTGGLPPELGRAVIGSEKGFVLILALVSMVAMTVIGLSLIMNMSTDIQLAGNEREGKLAFQLADAGINEAVARLRLPAGHANYIGEPDPPAGTANYRTVADWAGFINKQSVEVGANDLDYSVDISYLTEGDRYCDGNDAGAGKNVPGTNMVVDANGNPTARDCDAAEVVMYGRDFNLDTTLTAIRVGKYPVYRVLSTGTSGSTTRVIEAYVGASSLNIDTEGALNTNGCIDPSGAAAATVTGGVKEGAACGACEFAPCTVKPALDTMSTFLTGGQISELISTADTHIACDTKNACNAEIAALPDSAWGTCGTDSAPLIYIEQTAGPLTPSPGISGIDLNAGCGRGILIVQGNIDFSGGFRWEGLIYVLGDLSFGGGGGGGVNIEGGVMADSTITLSGASLNIEYNQATLMAVGKQNSMKSLIVWRRL